MTKVGENPPRLPKRFYKSASADDEGGSFVLKLDGRPAKTRAGAPLAIASRALAAAVVEEWNAQGEHINLSAMPLTRFATTALDLSNSDAETWRKATLAFLKSDLLCYRAEAPAQLAERQAAAWDPILQWAHSERGIFLTTGAGVGFLTQPDEAMVRAGEILGVMSAARALGVKAAAEIAGSAIIALALEGEAFPAEALFAASRVDENFQAERWGRDHEAAQREDRLRADFLDAARYLSLL